MTPLPVRHVARIVVVDVADAVLLVRYSSARQEEIRTYWVPPGGALEAGETHFAAARRELYEETGLDAKIRDELFERDVQIELPQGLVLNKERYFLVRLDIQAPIVHNDSPEGIEELRWWSLDALRHTNETIYPERFLGRISPRVLSAR